MLLTQKGMGLIMGHVVDENNYPQNYSLKLLVYITDMDTLFVISQVRINVRDNFIDKIVN